MDGEKGHCKRTERDAVIYSVKQQDTGLSEMGVTRSRGDSPGYSLRRKGKCAEGVRWAVKDSTVTFRVSPVLLVHVVVTHRLQGQSKAAPKQKAKRAPRGPLAYSLIGFQHQTGHCS